MYFFYTQVELELQFVILDAVTEPDRIANDMSSVDLTSGCVAKFSFKHTQSLLI